MMPCALVNLLRRCALPIVVLCLAVAIGAQAQEWKPYSYPSDGFRASFPSQPQQSKQNVDTKAGTFEMRMYIVETSVVALLAGVCDYGQKAEGSDPDVVLEGAKQGALSNTNSHLLREKKITLAGYHGLEFESENDTTHFTARIFMVRTTLYQIVVVYSIKNTYTDTARFLDSFALIARTGN
jgi:hypothetical protein